MNTQKAKIHQSTPKRYALAHKPDSGEQAILEGMELRLITENERERFDALICEHHYLGNANLVGHSLRYVATYRGRWLALLTWSASAYHLKWREEWIGWTEDQRRRRLGLVVNNSRFLILPDAHYPNLASRVMGLCLRRLSGDWQTVWGHRMLVAESFVDNQLFRGTSYKVSGWTCLGNTQGYGRKAQDYYVAHDRPKQLWVREIEAGGRGVLCGETLPEDLVGVELETIPRCPFNASEIGSLMEYFDGIKDWRRWIKRYYHVGLLAIIAIASFCGVSLGQRDLAAFALTLSQSQLRRLKVRRNRRTGRYTTPSESTFFRALNNVDVKELESALLRWQEKTLGPREEDDDLISIDGKELRGAQGIEVVSAVAVKSVRWLGSELVADKSNEIPAARELIKRLDLDDQTVVADALHTQHETARQIIQEKGADYVLTLKDNQKELRKTAAGLLSSEPAAFSPSGHCITGSMPDGGNQPRTAGETGTCGSSSNA